MEEFLIVIDFIMKILYDVIYLNNFFTNREKIFPDLNHPVMLSQGAQK